MRCWVDSGSFPDFWPERDSNLQPSAPQPSALTTWPRRLDPLMYGKTTWAATWHKTNKMSVRPAKTQISLGIQPVWSMSSLSAWRNLGSLATQWARREDSDQTGRMPRLIWFFARRTPILLVLSCGGSHCSNFRIITVIFPGVRILFQVNYTYHNDFDSLCDWIWLLNLVFFPQLGRQLLVFSAWLTLTDVLR